jgi:CAAX prenyl protease-like protein
MSENRKQLFAFVGPFAVFMVMTWLEGRPEVQAHYPFAYAVKIAAVCVMLFLGRKEWPGFERRGILLGVLMGAVGLPVWILLAKVDLLAMLPEVVRGWLGGSRTGYDPNQIADPAGRSAFISLRLFGLALVVPLMEELFWRGFLLRFLIAEPFTSVPIGTYTRSSFIIVTLAFVAAHPEILAALVWGAAINVLLYRTKNLWACVAMHATTNALLGAYILVTGSWHLW